MMPDLLRTGKNLEQKLELGGCKNSYFLGSFKASLHGEMPKPQSFLYKIQKLIIDMEQPASVRVNLYSYTGSSFTYALTKQSSLAKHLKDEECDIEGYGVH